MTTPNRTLLIILLLVISISAIYGLIYLTSTTTVKSSEFNGANQLVLPKANFAGAKSCQSCHSYEYQLWQQSDHYKSMQPANSGTVLADFSGVNLEFHSIQSRLYQQNDKYLIDTTDSAGKPRTFEIKNTFGFYPLQQYLVETEKGHVQALNIAWDSRAKQQGGQRWFHLQAAEDITSEHPFYWTNHFQNWNSRCADCHSTNVVRNYDAKENRFATHFSEINVACEACHGAGSVHIDLARKQKLSPTNTGFAFQASQPLQWQFNERNDIAQPSGNKNNDDIIMCGACHSLRGPLTEFSINGHSERNTKPEFHDNNRLQLINGQNYYADGQTKQEAFVLGSFLQTKMHKKGVSCRNCHNPHSAKVLVKGNQLCAQCHKTAVFDSPKHHHHQQGSTGSQCVNCHMPEAVFMQVDKRRDHSFTIPRPELSLALGVPNACIQCHDDKDNQWANQQTQNWGVKSSNDHWAHLLHRAEQNDVLATRPLVNAIANDELPYMVRASLMQHLGRMPSRVSVETAQTALSSANPLLRRAAVGALQGHAPELRWRVLSAYLDDPNRAVRAQIAETLADLNNTLPQEQQGRLAALIHEYRQILSVSADSVTTQLNIANLERRLGNGIEAENAYQRALVIEPAFVPALLGLADFYRGSDQTDKERSLLKKAVAIAPDSAAAQYSIGLHHVRNKEYDLALSHLKLAVQQEDAVPYYAYVYAVALENQGQLKAAIDVLKSANQVWPNQYELLMTLILYLEKSGKEEAVYPYISAISAIAPAAAGVQELIRKYQNRGR